jgi:hypothetical protein
MHNEVNKTRELAVLVWLMGRTYEERLWDGFRWHDIHTDFHDDRFRHSIYIKVITKTICEAVVLVLLMGRIYEVRHWDWLRWYDIHTKF